MRLRVIKSLTRARCSVSNSPPSRSPPRALVRRTAATGGRVDGSSDSRSRFVIDRRARVRLCRRRPRSTDRSRSRSFSKRRLGDALFAHRENTPLIQTVRNANQMCPREHRRGAHLPRSDNRPRPRADGVTRARGTTRERATSFKFLFFMACDKCGDACACAPGGCTCANALTCDACGHKSCGCARCRCACDSCQCQTKK